MWLPLFSRAWPSLPVLCDGSVSVLLLFFVFRVLVPSECRCRLLGFQLFCNTLMIPTGLNLFCTALFVLRGAQLWNYFCTLYLYRFGTQLWNFLADIFHNTFHTCGIMLLNTISIALKYCKVSSFLHTGT
jgi:hypothetical protein